MMVFLPSCGDHVHLVLLSVCGFRLPLWVKYFGERDLYQLRGMVLTLAPGCTLMRRGLLLSLVTS